jgi:hypothetical protein
MRKLTPPKERRKSDVQFKEKTTKQTTTTTKHVLLK